MSSARDTEPPATGAALHYFFGVLGFVGAAVVTLVLIALSSPSRAAAAASATAAQAAASRRVPLPSTRRSAAARAARRPSCRCHAVATRPSSPPPPAASGRCAGRSRPDPRAAVRAVVFVRVVRCISFEVHKLEFKRGEPCALSYRVVRLCRGGAVYEKYDGRARCRWGADML